MDRLGNDVARELRRFGPAVGMARLVEIWPSAVGPEIARNAWPGRLARDGTLHVHAKDSIWAFELGSRSEEVRSRLGEIAPSRIVFSPGPLPESTAEVPDEARKRARKPTREERAEAESLARGIRDTDLRKVVAKTIAMSLANVVNDRSFW
jgi:hypothetical protein